MPVNKTNNPNRQPAGSPSGGQFSSPFIDIPISGNDTDEAITVEIIPDLHLMKDAFDWAKKSFEQIYNEFKSAKIGWVSWSRTITRNISMLMSLMSETATLQLAQQALNAYMIGSTMTQLFIRAKVAFAAGIAGNVTQFIYSGFLTSQGILLGVVYGQAMKGQQRAQALATNISNIKMWSA